MLPNFFIVGAPKSGTTSLYHYLDHHPEVFMSPVKEPNYFSYEDTVQQNLYYKERGIGNLADYEKLFESVNGQKVIGEASVSYLFYENVPSRVSEKIPNAKILILLRNPVDRAFSHYFMDYKLRYINTSFEEVLYKKNKHVNQPLYYQQYIELGMYFSQVKRYLDAFGQNQVKIYIYEDLVNDVESLIKDLYTFLEIDLAYTSDLEKKYNSFEAPRNGLIRLIYSIGWLRRGIKKIVPQGGVSGIKNLFFSKTGGQKHESTIRYMKDLYKDDIIQLEKLIGRNLSTWYE